MTKKEFVKKWGNHSIYHAIMPDVNSVIQQAIAEHEAAQWKKYPEEKPDNQHYLCCADDGRQFVLYHDPKHGFRLMRSGGKYLNIIAFRELPKPYQEGGER